MLYQKKENRRYHRKISPIFVDYVVSRNCRCFSTLFLIIQYPWKSYPKLQIKMWSREVRCSVRILFVAAAYFAPCFGCTVGCILVQNAACDPIAELIQMTVILRKNLTYIGSFVCGYLQFVQYSMNWFRELVLSGQLQEIAAVPTFTSPGFLLKYHCTVAASSISTGMPHSVRFII